MSSKRGGIDSGEVLGSEHGPPATPFETNSLGNDLRNTCGLPSSRVRAAEPPVKDELTYCIGDIHGCAGPLEALLDRIMKHGAGRPRRLVFLGDYIDKGPESARAVAIVRRLAEEDPFSVTCLMGNRELALLQAAHDPHRIAAWVMSGGNRTLASYHVERIADLPAADLDWIASLKTVHEDELRYYVHAGFRPDRRGIDPSVKSRLWIREPFLSTDYDFGKHVVHGHTPCYDGIPDRHRHRTNLDTAPVRTGRLTAAVFNQTEPRPIAFLQSRDA